MLPKSISLGPSDLRVAPSDHICAFYPSLAERDEILIPYLREGLQGGDKCICIVDATPPEVVLDGLGSEVDLASFMGRGQLEVHRSEDSYLRDGCFSAEDMLDFWDRSMHGALHDGFGFARGLGEMTWALRKMPGVEELVGYEAKLNWFLPRYPQVILCLYELDRFSSKILVDVMKTHPKMLLGGMVLDNPYYLEPGEFLALRQ